jgi:hypothetical protein
MKKSNAIYSLITLLLFFQSLLFASEVQQTRDAGSGLSAWRIDNQGFRLELTQLLPDYIRAIYSSHGFPREATEDIASYCVFGTIVSNSSDTSLFYSVANWHAMTADGVKHTFKTKTQWLDEWRKMDIRYSWTILPTEQTFDVGDWSQGFTTIKLPREEPFDLIYSWKLEGEMYTGKIKNIRCAPINL